MAFRTGAVSRIFGVLIALSATFISACESDTVRTIVATQPPTETQPPTATPMPSDETPTATPDGVPTGTATAVPTGTAATETPTGAATSTMVPPTTVPTSTATAVSSETAATETPTPTAIPTGTSSAQLVGSIEQVYLTDASPGSLLELISPSGDVVDVGSADARGSYVWRDLTPGAGYTVVIDETPIAATSGAQAVLGPVTVTAMTDPPDLSTLEGQVLERGYGYLRTRDGTLLAINVVLPGPIDEGPYPALIEYSGYDPANPRINQPGVLIGPLLGFATVGVNMRGTGCSGGAFDYFEPAQSTDGYDAIEVVARQSWVKGGKVGMIGISYPGISQLFTAQLQPPSLAAIAPLSVISETPSTLYPGGILNNGFAVDWAAERQRDAVAGGQGWSQTRIDDGDQICIDNQKLKDQAPDIFQRIEDNPFYTEEVADPLSPATFVDKINVPVFLAGAWQDEQTGGHFPTMLDRFTGTDKAHFTMTNGGHTDSLGPEIFGRWFEFFSLYVADEIPVLPPAAGVVLSTLGDSIFGVSDLELAPDRFVGMSLEDARAAFEADPKVRILFDNGAGDETTPGSPVPGFEMGFDAWPIPEVVPTAWYLTGDDGLQTDVPTDSGEKAYDYNTGYSQDVTLDGGSGAAWRTQPAWHWDFVDLDDEVVFTSDALTEDLILVGSASVDVWLKSTATDTDVQVTLSEIRPDGFELYIQTGWLRAARRVLNEDASSDLRPVHTHREEDESPLTPGEFAPIRVELYPFGHAFRAGSSIRIAISTPGESRVLWKFDVLEEVGDVVNAIGYGETYPSKIVLPVIPGADIPTDYPPANAYRAQPSRSVDVTGG